MQLNNDQINFKKKKLFSKNFLQYNCNKISDKNKMKNYSQGNRKF